MQTLIISAIAKGFLAVQNIQGNLVLALSELLNRSGSSHWMFAGTAIRMSQIMRLNKEYHETATQMEQEIRRRTFWACTMLDRLLAFVLTKPLGISMESTAVFLPGSDAALTYQDASRGLTLSTLASFAGLSSDVGILPYFVKTTVLWGNICAFYICHKRFADPAAPTDPNSSFFKNHYELCQWESALPRKMAWTAQNYEIHSANGNGCTFVSMHFLIRSSHCVAHQTYLPHLDGTSVILDGVDAAGWPLLFREPDLISTCVTNALMVGKMLSQLMKAGGQSLDHLRSVWVAASLMSVACTFMWLLYANDAEFSVPENKANAEKYLDLTRQLFSSWNSDHSLVQAWITTIDDMHVIYRAAYLGQTPDEWERFEASRTVDCEGNDHPGEHDGSTNGFRPRPGDGFVPISTARDMYSALRLIMGDSTVPRPLARSVWMCFALGWPLWLGDLTEAGEALDTDVAQ